MYAFKLASPFEPQGDQPNAINALVQGLNEGLVHQVLLGVTGSGKTFTMANVIEQHAKPTLVIAPNKTLAAQLYNEFRQLFPENAVEYFVSYYDYYQPEAYIPTTDTYIQKDASINDMIDKLRHSATRSVLTRRDVIVVASVSCIFGLGAPEDYLAMHVSFETDASLSRDQLLRDLVAMQYERNDIDFHRGVFRVRGDRVEIFPAYEEESAIRVDFFGDFIDNIAEFDPLTGKLVKNLPRAAIFPASHYVTKKSTQKKAIKTILAELKQRVLIFQENGKHLEAQRIEERTRFDLEMIQELGYCNGIENYSRHLTGRREGAPPPTLLDYFPNDFLMVIDESHIGIPQLKAMYKGDRSRKQTLVTHGFRLPSALDNRPLTFNEWLQRIHQVVYISATPADFELNVSHGRLTEQIVRPTGLLDPRVEVRSAKTQVDDLFTEIKKRIALKEKTLVTTLTKRMAEDLTDYYSDLGLAVRYLHSDIKTFERMELIQELRKGIFDVLVGINLLREGLDIPEVSLVAILDADKEGFLRSTRSLIQTFGRAARNANGRVLLYAEHITQAMQVAMDETNRRRKIQRTYNKAENIIPTSIQKEVTPVFTFETRSKADISRLSVAESGEPYGDVDSVSEAIKRLEQEMLQAAKKLEFEKAALIRDQILNLKKRFIFEQ